MDRTRATGTLLAGAIFTDEQIQLLFAILIGILLVAALLAAVVVRSAIRLIKAPEGERSSNDKAIVGVALLVLVSASIGPVRARIDDYRDQRAAIALITETSAIPEDEFENGFWWDVTECRVWVMPLRGRPSAFINNEHAGANDQLVRSEALAFEAAGWTVTRYASDTPGSSGERAFRADRGDDAIALYDETSFGYKRLDSSTCAPDSGKIGYRRVVVDDFGRS